MAGVAGPDSGGSTQHVILSIIHFGEGGPSAGPVWGELQLITHEVWGVLELGSQQSTQVEGWVM